MMSRGETTFQEEMICLEGVSKKYNDRWILKDIDYSFHIGTSSALVGHNGCGKSTMLKMIAGLVAPTMGKIHKNNSLSFAYVPEKFMPLSLTARQYLRNMGKLDGLRQGRLEDRITQLAQDFFVEEMLDIPLKSMSKGTLQKIGVIQALLIKKDVLLLDEPLSGHDEKSQGVFVRKINELREQRVTIFMSCHEQWLVDAISDQVMTIQNVKLVPFERTEKKRFILYVEPRNENVKKSAALLFMKPYGSGFVMCIEETQVQGLIMSLISEGWILKGLYDENSKFAKISASDLL